MPDCGIPMSEESTRTRRETPLRRPAIWVACTALGLALTAGCAPLEVSVARDAPRRANWAVTVFPFDESPAKDGASDFTLYGYTGAQGSGSVVARETAHAFEAVPAFSTVDRDTFQAVLREAGLALKDLTGLDDPASCALAREMKAEMLVLGRVRSYRTSWFLFFHKAKTDLSFRGLDPTTGGELWQGRVRRSRLFGSPQRLAAGSAARMVAEVAGSLAGKGRSPAPAERSD